MLIVTALDHDIQGLTEELKDLTADSKEAEDSVYPGSDTQRQIHTLASCSLLRVCSHGDPVSESTYIH